MRPVSGLRWDSNWLAIGLAGLICFSCILPAAAVPVVTTYAARAGAQPDALGVAVVPLCLWARNGHVGLWWNSRVPPARAFANAHRYNATCVALPWSSILPSNGRPALDVTP